MFCMNMTQDILTSLSWPSDRLAEALELLAVRSHLTVQPSRVVTIPPINQRDTTDLERWMQFAATQLDFEAEPVEVTFRDVESFVRRGAPAVLSVSPLDTSGSPLFLLLLKGGRRVTLITPDLKTARIDASVIAQHLRHPIVSSSASRSEQFLARVGVREDRRRHVHNALLQELDGATRIPAGWILRVSPTASMTQQARQAQLSRPMAVILIVQVVIQVLTLIAWVVMSRQALTASYETVWLAAWGLLLLTTIPLQLWIGLSSGLFSTSISAIMKQRLIYGALNLHPDQIRHEGTGSFLGRIMDSEVVESAAIGNTFMTIMAVIQVFSAWGIFIANSSWPLVGLLLVWIMLIVGAGIVDYLISRDWYAIYRQMTQTLVEGMIGHRTRLAQQSFASWHLEEDHLLDKYLHFSQRMDRSSSFQAAISGTWLIAALSGLAVIFAAKPLPLQTVVISLGGILLAQQALQTIQAGLGSTGNALQAWQQVAPLFTAANHTKQPSSTVFLKDPSLSSAQVTQLGYQSPSINETTADGGRKPLMTVKNLSFRYRDAGRWIIQDCNLMLYSGDRLLLEGASGGGKTTLASLIAGLRVADSGVLLLHSYDQKSIGLKNWRRHVVMAPQFHENHIFTETFAFNVLMGRRYPPTDEDLQEAAQICAELGLSDLLNRMPSGFQQMVGESGWQLSHGERSRVFIARALLQNAEVIILDESFGALDAETLQLALECVLRRASTLIVIAHP